MANGYSAGNLYLNIDSVAYDTLKNLDAIIERLNIINSNLGTMKKGSKLGSLNAGTTAPSKKTTSFFNNFLRLGRWTAIYHIGRRLGSTMADIVTAGSDFGETLNLWKVAMGNKFLPQATEFVNKLNEAYGISKETLMNSQAIFKNMLGSLGQISEGQAYQLSEGITQMALDYASLYNVKFEDAMTKFQAALAGQVRPIRSVSGYDITENTLFQLYQQLGGEKTMRQLSRTEKQLLAIYAVFEQMDKSGATGDLSRTLHMWANQTRVMKESWDDIKTYAGLTVTRLLEQWGVMKYINAVLIFMSRILEGLATSLDTGLGESGDVFGEMEGGINDTTEAVENLQNALLDFDKFRALDSKTTVSDTLGIDQTILDAMKEYDGILEDADLEARKLADTWLKALGFVDDNNDGIIDMQNGVDDLSTKIDNINWGNVGTTLAEEMSSEEVWDSISKINYNLGEAIGSIFRNAFDLVVNLVFNLDVVKMLTGLLKSAANLGAGFWDGIFNTTKFKEMFDNWKKIFQFGIYLNTGKLFADGGLPDKGTMFVAGEAGAEMVYNMPSGQSGVANVRQIEQAMFNALARYGEQSGGTIVVQAYLDGEKVYENTTEQAKARGKVWASA